MSLLRPALCLISVLSFEHLISHQYKNVERYPCSLFPSANSFETSCPETLCRNSMSLWQGILTAPHIRRKLVNISIEDVC
jgi:hypothetical protein